MYKLTSIVLLLGLGASAVPQACLGAQGASHAQGEPMRVIYHIDSDSKGTTTALHQVKVSVNLRQKTCTSVDGSSLRTKRATSMSLPDRSAVVSNRSSKSRRRKTCL